MKSRNLLFLSAFLLVFAAPLIASAHEGGGLPYWGPLLSCTGNYGGNVVKSSAVTETCKSFCDLIHTAQHAMLFLITVALFALTPLLVAIGGGYWLLSHGNPEMITTGRQIITRTVIGVVLVLVSYVIVQTMVTILSYGQQLSQPEGSNSPVTGPKLQWGVITCNPSPAAEGGE